MKSKCLFAVLFALTTLARAAEQAAPAGKQQAGKAADGEEVTLTPEKEHVLADENTRLKIDKEPSMNGVHGSPRLILDGMSLDIASTTVIARGGYIFHLAPPHEFQLGHEFRGDVGYIQVISCKTRIRKQKKDAPVLRLDQLQGDLTFDVQAPIYYESVNGRKTGAFKKITGVHPRFVGMQVAGASRYKLANTEDLFVDLTLHVVSSFGAGHLRVKSGGKASIVLGPEQIAVESLSFKDDVVALRVTTTPKAEQAAALIVEYGDSAK